MHEKEPTRIDLQRFRKGKIEKSSIVKMLLFLFILIVLLSILFFLFQKLQKSGQTTEKHPVKREMKHEIKRIQIDTTGFRS